MTEEVKNIQLQQKHSAKLFNDSKRLLSTMDPLASDIAKILNSAKIDLLYKTDNLLPFHSYMKSIELGTSEKSRELDDTLQRLRKDIDEKAQELQRAKLSEETQKEKINQLQATINQLAEKEKLSFLLSRVNDEAHKLLFESEEFQKAFFHATECKAFVMSVDIRRSTELMSKARSPQQFAAFMTSLCKDLEMIIKNNYGVFDKFTGDGVLAFFPDFYSGGDGGYYAISAADRCHRLFQEKYKEYRTSFISVLKNVGLGIGIDYGSTHLVQIAGGLTVVGAPVVYACRMSGAPAGKTLLNQPGYEKISERFSAHCYFNEVDLDIKNEGLTLAYEVRLKSNDYAPSRPPWMVNDSSNSHHA